MADRLALITTLTTWSSKNAPSTSLSRSSRRSAASSASATKLEKFRAAVWRDYMTSNRRIHICVDNFALGPIEEFFDNCSASEVAKLQVRDKCRVYHYITDAFHKYRQSKNAYWETVDLLDAWLLFEKRVSLDAKQSIEECDWYDARLLKATMLEDKITHISDWEIRWECLDFLELWDAIVAAYEKCSSARIAGRNAFRKLAPLDQLASSPNLV